MDVWDLSVESNQALLTNEAAAKFFLADDSVMVLVIRFDYINADEIRRWFHLYQTHTPKAAVIVIGYTTQQVSTHAPTHLFLIEISSLM